MDLTDARRRWMSLQGLGTHHKTRLSGGWIRALGGVDPYLALFARWPNATRASIDAQVAAGDLWVVPGVRNCIWLVPREDVGLALRVGDAAYRKRTLRELSKAGVEGAELATLANQAYTALGSAPMSPAQLRDALGDAVRSLGDAGKKRGHTTALPAALRFLEGEGKLRRIFPHGRIDTNRVLWQREAVSAFEQSPAPTDSAACARLLADRFFGWAGPATFQAFVTWSGLTKTACQKAVAHLESGVLDGVGETLSFPGTPPSTDESALHLLPGLDNLISLRETPAELMADGFEDFVVPGMYGKPVAICDATWLIVRPIVRAGRIVGFWEYDPDAQTVLWGGLEPLDAGKVQAQLPRLNALFADLDHNFKVNAIDTPKRLKLRLDFVRGLPVRGLPSPT